MHPPKLRESIAAAAMPSEEYFITQTLGVTLAGRQGVVGVVPMTTMGVEVPLPIPLSALERPDRSGPCEPDLTPFPCACAVESRVLPFRGLPPNVGLTG